MKIPQQSLDRVNEALGDKAVEVFQDLALAQQTLGGEGFALSFHYHDEGDELEDGDLIPVVSFSLQRVGRAESNEDWGKPYEVR